MTCPSHCYILYCVNNIYSLKRSRFCSKYSACLVASFYLGCPDSLETSLEVKCEVNFLLKSRKKKGKLHLDADGGAYGRSGPSLSEFGA